ncbi:MAG: hypothetical protein OXU92_04160 [Deltaproteobacteria bacterium]|nr:hypothetical protein [Deltaproteobacteria bacterium]
MEDKSDRDETTREESPASATGEAAEKTLMPTSEALRKKMDELYERYGDAFRRLR